MGTFLDTVVKKHRVTLQNRGGVTLEVGEDEPIYDACLAAGIQLPIACKYGGCITCAGQLISGKVHQPKATALNRRQSRAGYILMCVARPQQDCVVTVGVETHGTLYVNPLDMAKNRLIVEQAKGRGRKN
jgi:ferredoxin